MKVRIRSLTGQTLELEDVEPEMTIAAFKARLESQESIPVDVQRLIFSGQELEDSQTLKERSIGDDAVVHLVIRQTRQLTEEEMTRPVPSGSNNDVQVAIPAIAPNHIVAGITPDAFNALQLGRIVKMFAVIDSIFILIWSLSQPVLIFAVVLPLSGYYGSINYNYIAVLAYDVYLALNIAYRSYFNVAGRASPAFIILNSLGILLEFYIAYIVTKFIRSVRALPEENRQQLRTLEHFG